MFLGLDIGTSAVKAVCVDGEMILATATEPLTSRSPRVGWSEQTPGDWWAAVTTALSRLAKLTDLSAVRGVGLSGQMHGAVALDAKGAVIRPAILWNDSRAAADCLLLMERAPDIGTISGVLPLPGLTAPKIMWMAREEPEQYARIAHLLLPKDYVGYKLHGQLATDRSDAAGTLWLDEAGRTWSDRIAEASDTDRAWLPRLFDGHDIVGEITAQAAEETGLTPGTPVVAGAGDAAAGAVSLGATEAGRGFISLGTSGQLFVSDRVYRPDPERYVHAFAHTLPERWYQMAAMLNGARPLSWFAGQLGIDVPELLTLAAASDAARAPLFLPYLTGERSPHGDPHIRAAFFGLEDSTDRSAMCRAVVEAVAFTFADAAESFGDTVKDLPELAAIGGGSRSDLLLQLIADATGKPIGRAAGSDAGPAYGAARLAACGGGALSLSDLAQQPATTHRFEPRPSEQMQDRLRRYRALYQAVKDIR